MPQRVKRQSDNISVPSPGLFGLALTSKNTSGSPHKNNSDDSSSTDDDAFLGRSGKTLTINAGDTIRYYDPIGIFGDSRWHRSAIVTDVRATAIDTEDNHSVEDQISLILHNRDCIANDTKVLVSMKATTVDGVIQRQEIPELNAISIFTHMTLSQEH